MRHWFAPLLSLAAACMLAAEPAPAQGIPPELQAYIPTNIRPYFLAFYVATDKPWDMNADLFKAHQAYMRSQFEAGAYATAGPLLDSGPRKGVLVIAASNEAAARAIAEVDPIVKAGIAAVEMHPVMLVDISAARAQYAK